MAEQIQRVMVVTAHPDDSEFGAGGTVAKLVKEGKQVTYCILTNGNKGSGDRAMTPERLAAIREEEQRNAARVLGVEAVDFLGFPDCELEDTHRDAPGGDRRHPPPPARPPHHAEPESHEEPRRARTATTAPPPASRSTASIPSPATTWPSPSCSPRGSSRTR